MRKENPFLFHFSKVENPFSNFSFPSRNWGKEFQVSLSLLKIGENNVKFLFFFSIGLFCLSSITAPEPRPDTQAILWFYKTWIQEWKSWVKCWKDENCENGFTWISDFASHGFQILYNQLPLCSLNIMHLISNYKICVYILDRIAVSHSRIVISLSSVYLWFSSPTYIYQITKIVHLPGLNLPGPDFYIGFKR